MKSTICEEERMRSEGFATEYVSNTFIATGNNYLIEKADNVTYRAYFPIEKSGELEYRFYFSNTVDSTHDSGEFAHVGVLGGNYIIIGASVADGGTSPDDKITGQVQVTFHHKTTKEVESAEVYYSDVVKIQIPEGHYLVWEWTLSGEMIPCIEMSSLTASMASYDGGKTFSPCDLIPLPQLVGAKRERKLDIAAIGDSITQGCANDFMKYEFWAAQIALRLGSEYSFYNCGLGWARSSDAAHCGNWLERTKNADVVIVAFGTNDILSGEYGGIGGNSAIEIENYVKVVLNELKKGGCKIILFNAPPFSFDQAQEAARIEYNERCKQIAEEYGAYFFDFASCLCDPSDPAKPLYGDHPIGIAGEIVADQFMKQFFKLFE